MLDLKLGKMYPVSIMQRRDFIKLGFAVGAGFSLKTLSGLFPAAYADEVPASTGTPALVAVRGGDRPSHCRAVSCRLVLPFEP